MDAATVDVLVFSMDVINLRATVDALVTWTLSSSCGHGCGDNDFAGSMDVVILRAWMRSLRGFLQVDRHHGRSAIKSFGCSKVTPGPELPRTTRHLHGLNSCVKSHWKDYGLKPDAANVMGNSREECCDVKKCDTFECPNNTQWEPNPKAVVGSTIKQCCTKKMCDTHTCSKDSLQKKPVKGLQGSTDDECCEHKFCTAWTCSDKTKWVHKSAQHGATNLDRRGFSDEECCDEKYCLAEICDPATQWKGKEGLDKIQGSTHEQCCEKIFCDDFVCDTDVNGTGVGTQWYKRVDTNTYKWQGSTNEECCLPIYCSQYTTSHPTRWVRKKDASLHGSTDVECYDPLWCSEYCCDKQSGLELRPNAKQHQGSTDEECCVKIG
ncbi:unnamed protein product [Symbiodinium sp. CCMP2592]|nr:unnamed protein product [Symbiodinium sp. CCMP2592]